MSKYILGIDQGLANCGIALLTLENSQITVKKTYYIKTKSSKSTSERLLEIFGMIQEIIKSKEISMIITENLHVGGHSNKSIVTVNMVTGIIYLLGGMNDIPVVEVVPSSVKKCVTGSGKASKDDVRNSLMMKVIFEGDQGVMNEHVTDAIALGFFGVMMNNKKISTKNQ